MEKFNTRFSDQEFLNAAAEVTWKVVPTAGGSNNLTKLLKEELARVTGVKININSIYDAFRRLKDGLPIPTREHYLRNLRVINRTGPAIHRRGGRRPIVTDASAVGATQDRYMFENRVMSEPKAQLVNVSAEEFVDAVLGKLISAETATKVLESENARLGDELIKKNKAIELLECQIARLMEDLKKRNSASIQALAKVACR